MSKRLVDGARRFGKCKRMSAQAIEVELNHGHITACDGTMLPELGNFVFSEDHQSRSIRRRFSDANTQRRTWLGYK